MNEVVNQKMKKTSQTISLAEQKKKQERKVEGQFFGNELKVFQRPEKVISITYKLKSAFVEHSLFITCGFVDTNPDSPTSQPRPVEFFINSKDLSHAAEYAILTRLISAIFQHTVNPLFILDELRSIYDPNGGCFKNGRYYPSLYAEIAEILERFFKDIGLLKSETQPQISELKV